MARQRKPAADQPDVEGGDNSATVAGAQLKRYLERIENLTEEKKALGGDIRDIFAEAKFSGLDPKIMRIILKRRAMDATERAEQDALVDTYSRAVGVPSPADAETVEDEE